MKDRRNVITVVLLVLCIGAAIYAGVSGAAAVKEREVRIEDLNSKIERLTAAGAEKDARIESLTAAGEDKDARIESLTAAGAEKDARIESLTAAGAEKDARIESLTAAGAEKDAQIEAVNASAGQYEKEIAALITESEQKSDEIENMSFVISENEELIAALVADIEGKAEQITGLSSELELARETKTAEEDLSGIPDGTCNNSKRFIALLQESDIDYGFRRQASGTGDDHIWIEERVLTDSGRWVDVTFNMYFDTDNEYIECYVWNVFDYEEDDFVNALFTCELLNEDNRYGTYYLDSSDNSVTLYACEHTSDHPDAGMQAIDMLYSLFFNIKADYGQFFDW